MFKIDTGSSLKEINSLLDSRERYYAGISESDWLELFISRRLYRFKYTPMDVETVQDIAKIGDRKLKKIRDLLYKKYPPLNIRSMHPKFRFRI